MSAIYVVIQIEVLAFYPTSEVPEGGGIPFLASKKSFLGWLDPRDEGVVILQYIGICLLNNTV